MDAATVRASMPGERPKPRRKSSDVPLGWRLTVVSRVAAAVMGGYLLAALSSVCLAQWMAVFLRSSPADAAVLSMTLSFLIYLPAVLWCFACRTALRAWLGLIVPSAFLAAGYACARWLL